MQHLHRPASLMTVGGFEPSPDPFASWYGKVLVAQPGEGWPSCEGQPMWPICQLNCAEMPYVPELLADVAFLTVFMMPHEPAVPQKWVLRAYPSLDGLVPLAEAEHDNELEPCPIRWEYRERDYPLFPTFHYSLENTFPAEDPQAYPPEEHEEMREIQARHLSDGWFERSKVGGWPTEIQPSLCWDNFYGPRHPDLPTYVFQLVSEEATGWSWGDLGILYFGRGQHQGKDRWYMAFNCG